MDRLPPAGPQPPPTTQARALTTGIKQAPFALWDDVQPTEPAWAEFAKSFK